MRKTIGRTMRRMRRGLRQAAGGLLGYIAVGSINGLRRIDPDRLADFTGWALRTAGPLLPENRIGRDNLVAAFPEKSPAEINAILSGAWDNLGRIGAEFAHLDRLWDFDHEHPEQPSRYDITRENLDRAARLATDGKPALIFAAHLANWELPAISAAAAGVDSALLYRRPNISAIDRWLKETRAASMGELIPTGLDAPVRLAAALERGAHVGMLVDQYYVRGVRVNFFGRPTNVNPLLARLARHFDCPIHGVRMIRLPGHRFRGEMTDAIEPARDAQGKVDVAATMQIITSVIEGWVREYPEQWLWQHRRWRPEDEKRRPKGRSLRASKSG